MRKHSTVQAKKQVGNTTCGQLSGAHDRNLLEKKRNLAYLSLFGPFFELKSGKSSHKSSICK